MRSDPISSAGLGGIGPEGIISRLGIWVETFSFFQSPSPTKILDMPRPFSQLNTLCSRGLRISQSSIIIFCPDWAMVMAKLEEVMVFPS